MTQDRAELQPHWLYCRLFDHIFYTRRVEDVNGHVRKVRLECSFCGKDLGRVVE